ncbi:MAG: SHOCT domain-containing protein [Candidatus Poribacteria bacterium]
MGPWMGYGTGGYGGIFMMIFGLLLMVGIVLLVAWLFRHYSIGDRYRDETPLEILKKRYARGEIDKDEFEQRKKDLM